MSLNYKNPLTSNQNEYQQSVSRSTNLGVTFSVLNTGGYMEVWNLTDLVLTGLTSPTPGQYVTGDTIPINILISNGEVYSPTTITLASDNISSGRRRVGMMVYVKETGLVYQYSIPNYDTLWDNALIASGTGGSTVVQTEFGTLVKGNSPAGLALIDAWTGSSSNHPF